MTMMSVNKSVGIIVWALTLIIYWPCLSFALKYFLLAIVVRLFHMHMAKNEI